MCRYCKFKLLVANKTGSVYSNEEENAIDIIFGNMDLTLQVKSFFDFNNFIQSINEDKIDKYINPLSGRIMVKPKTLLTGYCFTETEFYSLQNLLTEAVNVFKLELEIKHLLSPNYNSLN